MAPSAFWAMICRASSSALRPCSPAIYLRYSRASLMVMRLKSKIWQRERMVGITLCFSVVAKIKMAWAGGSSSVLRKALKAALESMCTSSMIYTLYLPTWGGIRTCSMRERMPSTLLLEAASSSKILKAKSLSPSVGVVFSLIFLARIRAQVVLPTPRGPVKSKACARWSLAMAFSRVSVIAFCPTTSRKVCGRYLRAETMKFNC